MSEPEEMQQETPEEFIRQIERVADYAAILESAIFFVAIATQVEVGDIQEVDDDLQAGVLRLYHETSNFVEKHGRANGRS